ncbi:succinate dehydrogenase flavoprotein subunit [Arthrobacter sp. Hiyo8]|nr:succinate dehydrogenase flavoprotein subunit [Arthrobacter sp. Hiyo8]
MGAAERWGTNPLVPSALALRSLAGERLASSAAGVDLHATTALSGTTEPTGALVWQPELVPEPFSRAALRRLMTAKAGVLRTGGCCGRPLRHSTLGPTSCFLRMCRTRWIPWFTRMPICSWLRSCWCGLRGAAGVVGAHYRSDAVETPREEIVQRYTIRRKASLVND